MTKHCMGVVGTTMMLASSLSLARAVDFPGPPPGAAKGDVSRTEAVLENGALAMRWSFADGHIKPVAFANKLSGSTLELGASEIFELLLGGTPMPATRTLKASDLRVEGRPELTPVAASPSAVRAAERVPGRQLRVRFAPTEGGLEVEWKAFLRDGSNYLRQETTLRAGREAVEIVEIVLLDVPAADAQVVGSVDGAPAVAGQTFFGYEHPVAKMSVANGHLRGAYPFGQNLWPGQEVRHSTVIGVYPAGQQRRGFLYYLERERAHPYRPFLQHENAEGIYMRYWQLQHNDPEAAALFRANQERTWREMIEGVAAELVEKRGVRLDAYVHDAGWDDPDLMWQFHNGFPHGFTPIRQLVEKLGGEIGIWFSPWGGYAERSERMKYAPLMGMESSAHAMSLAGPRYDSRFRDACVGMITKYGANYFKFDGFNELKADNSADGSTAYRSDVEALIRIIQELRSLEPEVFINTSSGSWPSPFWLLYSDSVWRGGSDTNVLGKGSPRQQWITYRDSMVRNRIVGRSPLYPISSLMIHGIIINSGGRVKSFNEEDMVSEIRSFFATGTDLRELYTAPDRMTPRAWDAIAESAQWSRANAAVLADTHWVGGDPAKSEVYGWASWSKAKGIVGLRNPDDQPVRFSLDVGKAFELPQGAATTFELKSPWKEEAAKPPLRATAGEPLTVELAPFQVLVFDAMPAR